MQTDRRPEDAEDAEGAGSKKGRGIARDRRTFQKRLKEARIGDTVAQFDVALMYANGVGVERDLEQALTWTRAAAENNHPPAQYLLANAYAGGQGAQRDELAAMNWLVKAAQAGYEKASLRLGRFFQRPHPDVAIPWLMKAATQGHVEAQRELAQCLMRGDGIAADPQQARVWMSKAALKGHVTAKFELGRMLLEGVGGPSDEGAARASFLEAANLGHAGARLELARLDEGRVDVASVGVDRQTWIRHAEQGETIDRYNLACLLERGLGIARDVAAARVWFERAAQAGHTGAQAALARLLEPDDPQQAADWYARAAEQGDANAQHSLARLLAKGTDEAFDALAALAWQARAAVQGHTGALTALQAQLADPQGVLAGVLLERATATGDADAAWRMGCRCLAGDPSPSDPARAVAPDPVTAANWFARAADQGHADARCAHAGLLMSGRGVDRDAARAAALYLAAAEQGHLEAQWRLGVLLTEGTDGVPRNMRQAGLWLRRAARAGYAPAQSMLGMIYARGRRHDRAAQWWALAADQEDPEALFNLANAFRRGRALPKNPEQAFTLLLRAAEARLAPAQALVGLLYATGDGVAQDAIEACKWFALGASAGEPTAVPNYARAQSLLSTAALAEAERRAAQWRKAHQGG